MNPKKIFDFIGKKNPKYELENISKTKIIPELLKFIDNPSEELQLDVINENPRYIRYIKNSTEKIQLMVAEKDPLSILGVNNPTEKVQLTMVENNIN